MELPLRVAEAALIANLQAALLLAIQDALQDALGDGAAAREYAGGASQAASFVEGASPGTRVYTLSVGLPLTLAGSAPRRRGRRAQAGAAEAATSAALSGLLDGGYLQARFAEAGVPDSDALFASGALALAAGTLEPPPPPPPPPPPTSPLAAGISAGAGAGIAAAAALLLLCLYGATRPARTAAPKAALQLHHVAAPEAPVGRSDIDVNIYDDIDEAHG